MHILRGGVVYPAYVTYCMWCNLAIRVQNCKICYYSFHPMKLIRDDIMWYNWVQYKSTLLITNNMFIPKGVRNYIS